MITASCALLVVTLLAQDAPVRFQGWPEADRPELEKLAKKAKKNGANYTLTGEVFETRLPTRESAAEFFLYFERLAADVRPLWGTRENTVRLVSIGVLPKNAPWPSDAQGQKIAYDQQTTKHTPGTSMPIQIASIDLWLSPEIPPDRLTTSAIDANRLNRVGLRALIVRLTGLNKAPVWFSPAVQGCFGGWRADRAAARPAAKAGGEPPASTRADGRPKLISSAIKRLAERDAVQVLSALFETPRADPRWDPDAADSSILNSFAAFLMEHKRGRETFTRICECISRGTPVEFGEKEIGKLVPHWRKWAGLDVAAEK
ncbi:MAG: hypothetical protein IPH13_02350 [Planctomycetes bacterium]|nr:hypothetical protein [Planctomycetota bacterium]MCC7172221.1 hypothetical protein [Planctomycetota bacterium]